MECILKSVMGHSKWKHVFWYAQNQTFVPQAPDVLFTWQSICGMIYLKDSVLYKIKTQKKTRFLLFPMHVTDEVMIFGSKMWYTLLYCVWKDAKKTLDTPWGFEFGNCWMFADCFNPWDPRMKLLVFPFSPQLNIIRCVLEVRALDRTPSPSS